MITGITRVRDEGLILEDTLTHFLAVCDRIVLLDDASSDNTVDIARSFDRVEVHRNKIWRSDRPNEETRHRAFLLSKVDTEWALCFDADERLEGSLPDLAADGYTFDLFDGYMTQELCQPYTGGPLADLPRKWGPECREILMLFKTSRARFEGRDRREPLLRGNARPCEMKVRHYGKCLSVQHWEDTCNYYANHWPNPYRDKWLSRKGKAIHTKSDFGESLLEWEQLCAS